MNLDKESTIGIAICIIGLFAWGHYNSQRPIETEEQQTQQNTQNIVNEQQNSTTKQVSTGNIKEKISAVIKPLEPVLKYTTQKNIIISNDLESIEINPNTASIQSVTLSDYLNSDKETNITFGKDYKYDALELELSSEWQLTKVESIDSKTENIAIVNRTFEKLLQGGAKQKLTIEHKWTIADLYKVEYEYKLLNQSQYPINLKNSKISIGALPSLQNLCGDETRMESHTVDYLLTENEEFESVDYTKDSSSAKNANIKWVAIGNKFFVTLVYPTTILKGCEISDVKIIKDDEIEEIELKFNERAFSSKGKLADFNINPNETKILNGILYAGPKKAKFIEQINPEDSEVIKVMHFGWKLFGWIALKLSIFLNLIYFCIEYCLGAGNYYGVSIILLTVIIKGCFWPITNKANASMKKMQLVQPKMKELREKHKDNPQLMNQKIMEFYKTEKINPLGGCLPILLQIPVFISLYWCLSGAIELRQVPFLWATDLTRPDIVATVFGLPIHPLVLLMTITMALQQQLTPASDPMQKKVMMLMPIMMLFFFYGLPSGLTLYWTVSQIISIIQLKINNKNNTTAIPAKA